MDANAILAAITSVGFPIVCCLLLFWYVYKRESNYDVQLKSISEKHEAEVSKLVEAVNNNTLVMQRLLDRLGVIDEQKS